MKVYFEPAAQEEVREAVRWYLLQGGQVPAQALSREIDGKVALLVRHPFVGSPAVNNLRRLHLRVFPYTLHYVRRCWANAKTRMVSPSTFQGGGLRWAIGTLIA